ncbi:MAG: hypothetical protein FWH47_00180 [Methanomassiliicoccaceae archaeon]|nr:hypothetical protein [Methanomassiliicoccaceae archaeon]
MGLKDMFRRKPNPYTKWLQEGEEKNKHTLEIILPPMDENGRFVPDRSRPGVPLYEYIEKVMRENP